jgi:hypothetical protein
MRRLVTAAVTVFTVVLNGCTGMSIADDIPARIIDSNAASRAALQDAVNDALGTQVLLARDALTASSVLNVTRSAGGGIGSPPTQGRNMESPMQFRLVRNNDLCILIDQRNDERHTLENTSCEPE